MDKDNSAGGRHVPELRALDRFYLVEIRQAFQYFQCSHSIVSSRSLVGKFFEVLTDSLYC